MRIVVAPLEFKETLTAAAATEAIAAGLRQELPSATLVERPMADGGPGTLDAVQRVLGGELRHKAVRDPLGRKVEAAWLRVSAEAALIETAQAIGAWRVAAQERDLQAASSEGAGELLAAAINSGARRIFIGLGGSATNDGGRGLLEALGVTFHTRASVMTVDLAHLDPRLLRTELIVLSDVTNPLLGDNGATYVYGPQKGAAEGQLEELESRMQAFAEAAELGFGLEVHDAPGAGAAGGLGFGLLLLGAKVLPGAEVIIRLLGIDEELKDARALVTGEGSYDGQSTSGKGAFALVELARRLHVPAYGIFGRVRGSALSFERVISLEEQAGSAQAAMTNAPQELVEAARRLGKETLSVRSL
jgi:glycerate 2-kinase